MRKERKKRGSKGIPFNHGMSGFVLLEIAFISDTPSQQKEALVVWQGQTHVYVCKGVGCKTSVLFLPYCDLKRSNAKTKYYSLTSPFLNGSHLRFQTRWIMSDPPQDWLESKYVNSRSVFDSFQDNTKMHGDLDSSYGGRRDTDIELQIRDVKRPKIPPKSGPEHKSEGVMPPP